MYNFVKRFIDICLSIIILMLIGPIILLIVIVLKLESIGPVFIKLKRIGKNCEPFFLYNFRTKDINNTTTNIGYFLNQTNFDALPQFINVLQGNMSIVGPMPARPYELNKYKELQMKRFKCRPGLTGLWQVIGRPDDSYEEMIKMDIKYNEIMSLWLDFRIMLKSSVVVLSRQDNGL